MVSKPWSSWKKKKEKSKDDRYTVDHDDFSEQVSEFTQKLIVLEFAGHGAVMSLGGSITEALKLTLEAHMQRPGRSAHAAAGGVLRLKEHLG